MARMRRPEKSREQRARIFFSNSKIVLSLYDDTPEGTFSQDFADKVVFGGITYGQVKTIQREGEA